MAYQVKQYAVAVEMLEEEFEKENNDEVRLQKAIMLAKSHDILQNLGEALKWYDIVDQLKSTEGSKKDLAESLKKNERYEDAASLYSELYRSTREGRYAQEAKICKRAASSQSETENTFIELFKANSSAGDYSPVYFEEDFILFSSDRESSTGKATYEWTGQDFSDLFVMNIHTNKVHNFDALLNTPNNEGPACFTKDYNEIFFTRCESINLGEANCRLYYSQRPNGFWMEPEPLLFFDEATNFGQPTLIENDSVLIFSASPKGSDGTYDLFYSVRVENGWSEAEIMPSPVNTVGNENFPTAFNDTLYFASDYHLGYGGLDIFSTYLRADGSWAPVQNMGYPINSGADDFGLAVKPGFEASGDVELAGYLSSSRNTGFGDDIFSFTVFKEEDTEEISEEPVVEKPPQVYDVYLAGRVVGLVRENDDPNAEVSRVVNLDDAYVRIQFGEDELALRTNNQGRFIEKLKQGTDYELVVSKVNYLNSGMSVSTHFEPPLQGDTTINIEIPLEKIIFDTEIVLENIYYDFNKWDIREDARPSLDTLSQLLKLNPQLTIQLSSHTDCRGELDFNNELSQKRAQSAVSYLTGKGIHADRLIAKGYGETLPAIPCPCDSCTEEEHQVNRRTTFKILRDRQN